MSELDCTTDGGLCDVTNPVSNSRTECENNGGTWTPATWGTAATTTTTTTTMTTTTNVTTTTMAVSTTTTSDTSAPTPAPPPVTAVEVEMKITEPSKFKQADYVQEMAKQTGVPVANVKVKSMEMKMSVGYSFKGKTEVTSDQAESAIAKSLKIEKSQVSVEILGRRLGEQLRGRKLEEETKIKATITMAANNEKEIEMAQEAHEKLADSKKSAVMLENVQKVLKDEGIEVELPEVTEDPQVDVKVRTEIVAVSKTPVVLPKGDDLEKVAEKAGAEEIEVKSEEVLTPQNGKTSFSSSSISLPPFMILTLALAATLLV